MQLIFFSILSSRHVGKFCFSYRQKFTFVPPQHLVTTSGSLQCSSRTSLITHIKDLMPFHVIAKCPNLLLTSIEVKVTIRSSCFNTEGDNLYIISHKIPTNAHIYY